MVIMWLVGFTKLKNIVVLICWKVKYVVEVSHRRWGAPLLAPGRSGTTLIRAPRVSRPSPVFWGRWSTLLPLVGHILVHQVAVVLNHVLEVWIGREVALHALVALVWGGRLGLFTEELIDAGHGGGGDVPLAPPLLPANQLQSRC